ncbi:3-oxoadipate enol-lactonase [Aquamicrobium sp. LC103]|uniref:3-oxoadipate enol-lactonase n=1 Tax=Aquamicrobium sp. LC103 TaxID=1120658 RepID=UPI00063ECBC3|nr:3-oxoadipate enol-lactonase [Aquamicrobium sp. LC103]TKT80964.1 3-oxoadipate enol-lactonase [Aquamicrobium sp. LC103]
MAFARVNGVVLHHQASGKADGPALVFSNSLGTDFRIWDEVAAGLGKRYRLIRYDKRGHGLSEATPHPYGMNDHVADLAALLDHLGVTRAAVVGLSVGGLIAQGLAAKRPDLVAALVLCDTAHKIGTAEMWNDRIATVTTKGIAAMADAILQRWFTEAYRSPDNADFVGYTAMLTRTTVDGYAGTCAALRDADLTESTRALKLPALCVVGDQDGSTPPDLVRSTADLIEGARFEIIADAGHIPCVEKPAETTRLIGRFLEDVGYS